MQYRQAPTETLKCLTFPGETRGCHTTTKATPCQTPLWLLQYTGAYRISTIAQWGLGFQHRQDKLQLLRDRHAVAVTKLRSSNKLRDDMHFVWFSM